MNGIILSFLILILYLTPIIIKFGIPKSLSESFYLLNGIHSGLGYLFTIAMWGIAFTLLPAWLDMPIGVDFEVIKFFTCASLCFVGAAPRFKDQDAKIHTRAAMLSAFCAFMWIIIFTNLWYLIGVYLIIALILMYLTKTKECITFWLEMVMFFSLYTTLLLI